MASLMLLPFLPNGLTVAKAMRSSVRNKNNVCSKDPITCGEPRRQRRVRRQSFGSGCNEGVCHQSCNEESAAEYSSIKQRWWKLCDPKKSRTDVTNLPCARTDRDDAMNSTTSSAKIRLQGDTTISQSLDPELRRKEQAPVSHNVPAIETTESMDSCSLPRSQDGPHCREKPVALSSESPGRQISLQTDTASSGRLQTAGEKTVDERTSNKKTSLTCSGKDGGKRKDRKEKRRHIMDDSAIIGMFVQFDPTCQLLDAGEEPAPLGKAALKKLSRLEVYAGSLLGSTQDEESESGASNEEGLFDFQLDSFAPSADCKARDDSSFSFDGSSWSQSFAALGHDPILGNESRSEEIEIVFCYGDEDDTDSETDELESEGVEMDKTLEQEIVFYACREEESQSDCVSSRYSDCRSEVTPLPSEWFLPQQNRTKSIASPKQANSEAPAYEWFHPDHLDLTPSKKGSFVLPSLSKIRSSTVATCIDSSSSSTEELEVSESGCGDVLSVGSGTSQVVQNLIQFVGIG